MVVTPSQRLNGLCFSNKVWQHLGLSCADSPAVDVFDKSSSESVREPCQYNYMFVVEAKKVDLTDVGIVGCLSAGTEEKDKGLPNSLHTGRAMGAGSGLGKSTGYSTSTTTDMDDFFSSLSFQK
ncbi:clathrin interactor EPSIN 1 [Tanacetum coccineum]